MRLDPDGEPAHVLTRAERSTVERGARPHDRADAAATSRAATPDWFKSAVFYEVLVRSFRDSNGDGIGDFRGLIEKLDYLQWLGVDCLWLPPFFTSPLRDGGYDVADYTDDPARVRHRRRLPASSSTRRTSAASA